MSPTVFKEKGYRFFFFSREETRMHVHVNCGDGEAKFWLRPTIEPARTEGLSLTQIKQIGKIIERRRDEIENAWKKYFLG